MSYIGNQPTSTAFVTDTFNGNGSTVAFTMSVAPAGTTSVLVAVTGVVQDPSTYSVSGTTLTFSSAPPSGTGNISVRYLGIPASGVTTTAYRTVTEFTATAGQTSFSTPSYTVGYINVYRNGVLLGSADYTATTGTTVVLAKGASAGDLVTTESFYVSSVLNAIPNNSAAVQQTNIASGVAGTGPAFSAYTSGNIITFSAGAFTKVTLDVEEFDTNSNFASNRFTPAVAGYYQINGAINFATATGITIAAIFKNGSRYKDGNWVANSAAQSISVVSSVVYLNGSTDYVELYGYNGNASNIANNNGGSTYSTYLNGSLTRAA